MHPTQAVGEKARNAGEASLMARRNSDADREALSAGCTVRCSAVKIFMALNYAKIAAIILRTCHVTGQCRQ